MTVEQRELSEYTVVQQLHDSPLGEAVKGEHRYLQRPFILQTMEGDAPPDEARFAELVAAWAHLKHPYLLPLHTASLLAGRLGVVSECPRGEWSTLADLMQQKGGLLAEEEARAILEQVAAALDYLHGRTPTQWHGSLHPRTILVQHTPTEAAGLQVRLMHVGWTRLRGGIVAQREQEQDVDRFLRLCHALVTEYPSLSPEQRRGEEEGAPADVWAFGVLVYQLLTGAVPEGVFDSLSQRLGPHAHRWDRVVAACLRPDIQRRWSQGLVRLLEESYQTTELEAVTSDSMGLGGPVSSAVKPFSVERVVSSYAPPPPLVSVATEPLHTPMLWVEGGAYLRGSDQGHRDEAPAHHVTLQGFAIDIHPVTNEQFLRFLEGVGGEKDAQHNDLIRLRESRIRRSAGKLVIEPGYARHPVVGVSWYGATAYAAWVGKRLPTEAEWEAAAHAGGEGPYPSGETIEKRQANFFSSDTTAVMSYPPNAFGLFDMAGNVYEWCADWYSYNYYDLSAHDPVQPKGPLQGIYRVLRGGCWRSVKEDLRCAHRHRNNPGTVNSTYGFRCASDIHPQGGATC